MRQSNYPGRQSYAGLAPELTTWAGRLGSARYAVPSLERLNDSLTDALEFPHLPSEFVVPDLDVQVRVRLH